MTILLLTLVLILAGCSGEQSGRSLPTLPDDRAPRVAELIGLRLEVELSYPNHPDAGWAAWRGTADVTFGGPQAGIPHLPAEVALTGGFDDLDGCLSGAPARWSLDETSGFLTLIVGPRGTDGSQLTLVGPLVVSSSYAPSGEDGDHGDGIVVSHVEGLGDWGVLEGAGCDPGDFAGGTQGAFTAREIVEEDVVHSADEHHRGPRARLLVVGDDGSIQAEIVGPAARVAALVSEEL